jgi:MYXO-CTERM domain-containing protein
MSFQVSRALSALFGGAVLLGMTAVPASAATLVLEGVTKYTTDTTFNLSTDGATDWAYWNSPSSTLQTPPVEPTNEKSGGTAIGSLGVVGGGSIRGTSSGTVTRGRYTYTDGTSPASATAMGLSGLIFNSQLGSSAVGKGLTASIAGDVANERVATLYLGGFAASASLSLSLGSTTLPVDTSQVFSGNSPKEIAVYRVRFKPDLPGDNLVFQYTASAVADPTNGHVGLEGIAVAPASVPEPTGSIALLGLAALAAKRRRRRA